MSRSLCCSLLAFSAVFGGLFVSTDTAVARQFKQLAIAIINYQNSLPPVPSEEFADDVDTSATLEDSELYFGDEYLENLYWELVLEQELELDSSEAMWLYDELMRE